MSQRLGQGPVVSSKLGRIEGTLKSHLAEMQALMQVCLPIEEQLCRMRLMSLFTGMKEHRCERWQVVGDPLSLGAGCCHSYDADLKHCAVALSTA